MQKVFKILFYENGDPIAPRCIERFIGAFSKSYSEVVGTIIEKSETPRLDFKVFEYNIAKLMPSFKMTRAGAFRGVRIDEKDRPCDPNKVINNCWEKVEDELRNLKKYLKQKASGRRSRVLVDLSPKSRNHVIKKGAELFEKLLGVKVKTGRVSRVGASKVLFAVLPEIALPVDNLEWKSVFKTTKYQDILSTMANEIREWEGKFPKIPLEKLDPNPKTTLPAIYNVMAMAARPLKEA
ncbi:hypothetical protein IBX38_06550 [Candidatus Bathyarchaeota archaeon]|nr:hypothetical protein [Candidatus Bathyarchaeota archaeon]